LAEVPNSFLIARHSSLFANIHHFTTVTSTNDVARQMALAGSPEGTGVCALEQTAGRGRQGRSWSSPPGHGLYLSVILRPKMLFPVVQLIPLAGALAVARTLADVYGVSPDIKWPNDIIVGGRKACGILVESSTESGRIDFAILGIGINLGQEEFPEDIRATATSMLKETGLLIAPDDLLGPLLERLEKWYGLLTREPASIIEAWEESSSYARDCRVVITTGEETFEGITAGLSQSGALIVEMSGGHRREVLSGEVRLRRVKGKE
jgi:BirA family biotin operon repressor/biotin-[acetyl-CoA-carboxylase] ligase